MIALPQGLWQRVVKPPPPPAEPADALSLACQYGSDRWPCAAAVADRLQSGQLARVQLFFHPVQIEARLGTDPLATILDWFNKEVWPWPAKPQAYIDQRLLIGSPERCYQHAKVVVADADTDRACALVTSPNFSETAQRHNFEAGWLVREPWRARQVSGHFQKLVSEGLFRKLN